MVAGDAGASRQGAQADLARSGPYLGLGATIATPTGHSRTGAGINVQVGYRFLAHLAAEFDAEWIGEFPNDDRNTVRAGLNLKAPIVTGRFQPYVQAGLDMYGVDGHEFSNTDVAVPPGAGLDFYATEHVVLGAGFAYVIHTDWIDQSFDRGMGDYVAVGLGLQYRF
jgi:opacity protein-like surface antigen